jgi:hypothetical protein
MTYQSLGLLDVLVAKQELPIEVAQINGVQIDNMDLAKAREHKILQQFASDTASAHHQHARLYSLALSSQEYAPCSYLFDAAMQRAEALGCERVACHCAESDVFVYE